MLFALYSSDSLISAFDNAYDFSHQQAIDADWLEQQESTQFMFLLGICHMTMKLTKCIIGASLTLQECGNWVVTVLQNVS